MLERDYLRRGTLEFVGVFALIFVAAGGAAYARSPIDLALANGLVIAVMVCAAGPISGGHINPAVTLGFLVTRRITPPLAVVYWVAQFGGAIEAVLTFFLVWVVFATAVDPRGTFKQIAGLAIGFVIAFDVLMAYGLTGGAMNPARAFGPQLAGNHWAHGWIWYVGPFAGGVIAASLYELLYLRPARPEPVGTPESGVDEPRAGDAAVS
jgi:aquaporin Z